MYIRKNNTGGYDIYKNIKNKICIQTQKTYLLKFWSVSIQNLGLNLLLVIQIFPLKFIYNFFHIYYVMLVQGRVKMCLQKKTIIQKEHFLTITDG